MLNSLVATKEPSFRKAGEIFDDDYYRAFIELLEGGPLKVALDPALDQAMKTQKSQMDAGISGTFVPVTKYG